MHWKQLGIISVGILAVGQIGCSMYRSEHEAIVKTLKAEHAQAQQALEDQKANEIKQKDDCLEKGRQQDAELVAKQMQIDDLLKAKGALADKRKQLSEEQKRMAQQIKELQRMQAAAEKRSADYRAVLKKLQKMIDAGTLQVKIRNGRMLVQMASDVVFGSGSIQIKPEAEEALNELAQTIMSFPDRKFQVLGHSDSTPIRTERFPSNWELSTQRAVRVVKLMIDAGVPPEMLSAAGSAEFDPLIDNETPEGRSTNRRVEIVFMPKIDELPGFDQVLQQ